MLARELGQLKKEARALAERVGFDMTKPIGRQFSELRHANKQ